MFPDERIAIAVAAIAAATLIMSWQLERLQRQVDVQHGELHGLRHWLGAVDDRIDRREVSK